MDGSGASNGWKHGYFKLGRFDVALHERLEQEQPRASGHCGVSDIGAMAVSARKLRGLLD